MSGKIIITRNHVIKRDNYNKGQRKRLKTEQGLLFFHYAES